jgi:hypothetical protein
MTVDKVDREDIGDFANNVDEIPGLEGEVFD